MRRFLSCCSAAVIAGSTLLLGTSGATAATQTHEITFTGAGGDATYGFASGGPSDDSVNLNLYGVLPLFDPALGTLQQVSVKLSGWRSLDFTCAKSYAAWGYCAARIDSHFHLDIANPQASPGVLPLASIRPWLEEPTQLWPEYPESLSITIQDADTATTSFSDPVQLAAYFIPSGSPGHQIRLRFSPEDGGYFGYGGSAFMSEMRWTADATATVTYHYAAVVPEPRSAWLALAGLALITGAVMRRRP